MKTILLKSKQVFTKIQPHLLLIIAIIIPLVIFTNNYRTGTTIMGFDNASNYFFPIQIFSRIHGTGTYIYGGLIFTAPFFELLRNIGFSYSAVSWIYWGATTLIASIGYFLLSTKLTSYINKNKRIKFPKLFIFTIYTLFMFNGVSLWALSSGNFVFLAFYGAFPSLLYFLIRLIEKKRANKESTVQKSFLLLLFISTLILTLTTSLNLVIFFSLLGISTLLALIVNSLYIKEKLLTISKKLIFSIVVILAIWITSLSLLQYGNTKNISLISDFSLYVYELQSNEQVTTSTKYLLQNAKKENTITRSITFTSDWVELTNQNNTPMISFYNYIKSPITFLPIIILFIIILSKQIQLIFIKTYSKQDKVQSFIAILVFIMGVFLISKYFTSIIDNISILNTAFRSNTSKLWPFYLFSTILLSIEFLKHQKKYYFFILIITFTFLANLPLFSSNLLPQILTPTFPSQLLSLNTEIPHDKSLVILPKPKHGYFRYIKDWGYYGSDFFSYITKAEIVDQANLYQHTNLIKELYKDPSFDKACEWGDYILLLEDEGSLLNEYTVTPPQINIYEYKMYYCK